MPTYDYLCDSCGHEFEKFESITARVARKCPECKKMSLNRLIGTGAGIIFKGGGFYATDYRSESYKQDAKKDAPKAEKSDTKIEKSDTKVEKKDAKAEKKTKKDAPKSTDPKNNK